MMVHPIRNMAANKSLLFYPSKSAEVSPFSAMMAQNIISRYPAMNRGRMAAETLIFEIFRPIFLIQSTFLYLYVSLSKLICTKYVIKGIRMLIRTEPVIVIKLAP